MSNAEFSPCRQWRYTLTRLISPMLPGDTRSIINFVCLNPSTADETTDDNTVRKCIKFARSWELGFNTLIVTNLFAWRSTQPSVLKTVPDPIGEENDHYLLAVAGAADMVVAAWGAHGKIHARSEWFTSMFHGPIHILRISAKTGEPWHPLYLPDTTQPILWRGENGINHK